MENRKDEKEYVSGRSEDEGMAFKEAGFSKKRVLTVTPYVTGNRDATVTTAYVSQPFL